MAKTIGILGGMGPLATADLFRKITLLEQIRRCERPHAAQNADGFCHDAFSLNGNI